MLAVDVNWNLFNRYQDVMSLETLLGLVIAVSVAGWLVHRMRARFREDSGRADAKLEMLTQFRELHQQGELTEDEYRLIRSRLAREAGSLFVSTSADKTKPARGAVGDVRQEGGTEKAGETGRDDGDLDKSRSAFEPPNQKSTALTPLEWNASGMSPDPER
jgi:hypothetical protein